MTKTTTFKPNLAIDATNHLDTIKYPKYASMKLDGIRCIFHPQLGMVSRSLKQIQNKQLQEKFKHVLDLAIKNNCIYDGELYGHTLTFQEITRAVMTQDFTSDSRKKKLMKELNLCEDGCYDYCVALINDIEFHCFDRVEESIPEEPFENRREHLIINEYNYPDEFDNVRIVDQRIVESKEDVETMFKMALDTGYEGLILRDPNAPYKFGRSTLKEEHLLKVKPFGTTDTKILGIKQATVVDPNAEKITNELGRSVTSKKKGDRIPIEKASGFIVDYNGLELVVSIALTDEEKIDVWKNKESYIGRMIEYKSMTIGAKDLPRHPVFVRFRDDKN